MLFKIALVSDTHVNEKEDFSASPYEANAKANPRARHIFSQVNQTAPAFTIHLGDMVNPVPELPSFVDAATKFHQLSAKLEAPLHLMPGNHDIGDKPVTWMPAGMVNSNHIALYREHFGEDYYSFDFETCHFIILNSSLINSGDPAEAEQAAWLEADLGDNADVRTFMFSHYPVYVSRADEPESYDNIDEPGRGWLLALIQRYRPEALFSAHVHNFWYDVIGDTEYYIVPSTCFVRHDYSEMYRIDGGDQQGRNDTAKLGHITLEIHETGHVAHYHRSYGICLADGADQAPAVVSRPHTKTSQLTGVYVDMRHAWAEEMVVAPSGAVDEFRRKKARNDYPVMAMWEMGLRGMRVPIQDLLDPLTRRRMSLMCDVGHQFHVYRYGLPGPADIKLLTECRDSVFQLELVVDWGAIAALTPELRALKDETGLPIILSRVNRQDAAKHSGGRFNHLISHGFTLEETEELGAFLAKNSGLVAGFQFTISRSISPWTAARTLGAFSRATGSRGFLYVKSNDASPAQTFPDEIANAERFAKALIAGVGHGIEVILDTFDDADRGYFTRTGLVDRRFNPRIAARIISSLVLELSDKSWRAGAGDTPALHDDDGLSISLGRTGESYGEGQWVCPVSGASGNASALEEMDGGHIVILKTPRYQTR
ncbi:MAG: metallophosphoesterase [Alphaproteobacteria bacterium]|nr:metallophosphoesterase [Alphaproteobacteria bacterium]